MPDSELFTFREVRLQPSLETIDGRADFHAKCSLCGEKIINQREVYSAGQVFCQTCFGRGYYSPIL
jgi:formylmethanofuran dehydrogenase subunit E